MTTVDANITRAAKVLGLTPREIAEADDAPAGFVITTTDGVRYVDVPADTPDAEGKAGLMFLVPPRADRNYSFPVYTHPEPDDEPDVEDSGDDTVSPGTSQTAVESPPRRGRGSGEDAWRAFAAAHDVDLDGCDNRDDVIAACEDAGVIEQEGDDG